VVRCFTNVCRLIIILLRGQGIREKWGACSLSSEVLYDTCIRTLIIETVCQGVNCSHIPRGHHVVRHWDHLMN
jgi:hypothetical protein